MQSHRPVSPSWDIFCQVVDNYGDVGIAWRLARQLVAEHHIHVRLWVDDLAVFQHLWPEINPKLDTQNCLGVEVRAWQKTFPSVRPAQVVIEAFGCALPEAYLSAMSSQVPPAVWINLEYLSAEPWVKAHHGLPSPHPRLPLTKFFFFPGYEEGTGGVLGERDLAQRRQHFQLEEASAFWQSLGLAARRPSELRISMFAYENAALIEILGVWRESEHPITLLIPEGKIIPQLAGWLGEPSLPVGTIRRLDKLELHILPFLNQDDYDRLLWACDINLVRGEDSCVRAQWAQKPFIWQPYPQQQNAHWDKLEALIDLYVEGLPEWEADVIAALWRAWNGRGDVTRAWTEFMQAKAAIDHHAIRWTTQLAALGDLAANLVAFVEDREAG